MIAACVCKLLLLAAMLVSCDNGRSGRDARLRPLPTQGADTCGPPREPAACRHARTGRYVSAGGYAPCEKFSGCRPQPAAASEDGRRAFATSHDGGPTAFG